MPRLWKNVEVVSGAEFYKGKKPAGVVRKFHKRTGYTYTYDPDVTPIRGFSGEHRYLSNFWKCDIPFWGEVFPTSEHAYMFFKSQNPSYRHDLLYRTGGNPRLAKKLGRCVDLHPNWEALKYKVMFTVVARKFATNPDLRRKLLDTGYAYIEETNTWNDLTWGVCNGEGHNHLGRILMAVRHMFRHYDARQRKSKCPKLPKSSRSKKRRSR